MSGGFFVPPVPIPFMEIPTAIIALGMLGFEIAAGAKDLMYMNQRVNVQHVTCHELVHACSAHLMLPMWLNEGIATATVDRFMGRTMVRQETLEFVRSYSPKAPPPTYRQLSRMGRDAIAYHGIRGYWIVRYLEQERPGFLRRALSRTQASRMLEHEIVNELGMKQETFWMEIDDLVAKSFRG